MVLLTTGFILTSIPWLWGAMLNAKGALGYTLMGLVSVGLILMIVGGAILLSTLLNEADQ